MHMASRRQPQKICFVTQQLYAWEDHAEFSDATYAIAQAAAGMGDKITFLWAPLITERRRIDSAKEDWIRSTLYERYLIKLEILDASPQMLPGLYSVEKASHSVYHHLKTNSYDAVFFALEGGLGYYSLLSRELGLFDNGPKLFTIAHAPLEWRRQADKAFVDGLQDLTVAHMEQYCAQASQNLICTSRHLKRWMSQRGWKLPKACEVLPPLRPYEWHFERTGTATERKHIDELIFFSGNRYRHGITLFASALDRLAEEFPDITVTTLGKFGSVQGEHSAGMLLRCGRRWPFALKFLPELTEREAVAYLKRRNGLAIIPSLAATIPQALLTCVEEGIPFVATDVGGATETVYRSDVRSHFCSPKPADLARIIAERIREGASSARPAQTGEQAREKWDALFAGLGALQPPKASARAEKRPLVSVIMAHFNRPHYLPQAVAAVERQDYPNIELIIVDDGSTLPEAVAVLEKIELQIGKRGWRVIRTPNRYLGAARNEGVRASRGERILFVDDDNALFDGAISTFVSAMDRSGADICTTFSKVLHEQFIPANENTGFIQYLPLGGSLPLGLVHNSFGDANAMIRRSVIDRIGYQIEDYGCTVQDWEYFARAVFAGLKLRIIPEPLYWYRSDPEGMYRSSNWYDNRLPILNVYREHKFADADLVPQMFIAQNIDKTDLESAASNLQFSASNALHQKLAQMSPNAPEARTLLAEIAAIEGRPETGLMLLAREQGSDFRARVGNILQGTSPAQRALVELGSGLSTDVALSPQDLRAFTSISDGRGYAPLFYLETPDRLFLAAEGNTPSIAVLAGACDEGSLGASAKVSLGDDVSASAEFLVLMVPEHVDPNLAVAQHRDSWSGVSRPGEPREIAFDLSLPADQPMKLVIALRRREKLAGGKALGMFEGISVRKALGVRTGRPRLGAPPLHQRARVVEDAELKTAKIVTKRPYDLPPILIAPNRGGLFLRPDSQGPVVASLEWLFPPFARKVVAQVEIAHEDASPLEFSMALVRPEEEIEWRRGAPKGAVAFSGWMRVEENFVLHDLSVALRERIRSHLSLQLGIRVPKGSAAAPANAYFRKLVFVWED